MDKEQAKVELEILLERYNKLKAEKETDVKSKEEEKTKLKLIRPLFEKVLGWKFEEDVTAEEKISKGWVDYGFRINESAKFFLEAKSLKEDLENELFFRQAVSYAYYKGCTWAILTNFEKIKILNAEWEAPVYTQSHFMTILCTEFLERFDDLWLLSRDGFDQGLLDKLAEKFGKRTKKWPITRQLTGDFTRLRTALSKNITKENQSRKLTEDELDESVQRILNRLIFIRNCEDRELEEKKLWEARNESSVWKHVKETFRYYDMNYDSKLFTYNSHNPADQHICDTLNIDNGIMRDVIDGLYHSKDKSVSYDFKIIPADVLGIVYEQYLSHILRKTTQRAKLSESNVHKKEQGIFYTPTYIVDYIVRNTLGELLKQKKIDAEKLKVLDISCGSGNFLIKAFDILDEHYLETEKYQTKFDLRADTLFKRKSQVLKNNLFGVDLDRQAVEIAQLNLLLKIAEKAQRLPVLEENIKCGNSLIDNTEVACDKAFNWKDNFGQIMSQGGFDIIIGNPPYERILHLAKEKSYYSENYFSAYGAYDIYVLFIEKALNLLKEGGYLGFIVSNKFMVSDYGLKIRKLILENTRIIKVIDLADANRVFSDALVSTAIIILQKARPKPKYKLKRFIADKNTVAFKESLFEEVDINDFVAKDGTFNVRYAADKESIYEKLNKLETFGKVFDVRTGIMGFEYWKMEPYIHNKQKNANEIRIATNSYIDRYTFLWKKQVNLYKKKFTEPYADFDHLPINQQTKDLFLTRNKIIVRGVAKRLTATLDNEGIGLLVAVHQIQTTKKYAPKLVLGILNSSFFNWLHKDRFYLGRIPEGSLKYPIKFLKKLPIPPEDHEKTKTRIIAHVDTMLQMKQQLAKLDDKKTDERAKLEQRIKVVDEEINQMVYEIYRITEKEKAIIENS